MRPRSRSEGPGLCDLRQSLSFSKSCFCQPARGDRPHRCSPTPWPHNSQMGSWGLRWGGVCPKVPWPLVTGRAGIRLSPFFPDVAFRYGLVQGTCRLAGPTALGLLALGPQSLWACVRFPGPAGWDGVKDSSLGGRLSTVPGDSGHLRLVSGFGERQHRDRPPAEPLAAHRVL